MNFSRVAYFIFGGSVLATIALIIIFYQPSTIQEKEIFVPKVTISKEIEISSLFNKCIQNADHPVNKTDGPDWDILDADKALKICNLAYTDNPNSVEIIRSLARIYIKKKDYKNFKNFVYRGIEKSDLYSRWLLGVSFEEGEGVIQDYKKAFKHFKIASDQRYVLAQVSLGRLYKFGDGVEKDLKRAFKYFKLAADQGNSDALYHLGYSYSFGEGINQDYKKAFKYFKLAADQGNSEALYYLGYSYSFGEGINQDYKEAFKYFKLAADQGNSDALYYLGYSYSNGQGINQDYKEAFKYFKLAADQGIIDALYYLGYLYSEGEGINQDHKEAFKYFNLAADQNNASALYKLGNYYEIGFDSIEKNIDKAQFYYNKLINFNKGKAYHGLGRIYLTSPKRISDTKTGLKYLEEAIDYKRYEALVDIFDFYFKKHFKNTQIKKKSREEITNHLMKIFDKVSDNVEALDVIEEVLNNKPEYINYITFNDIKKVIENLHDMAIKKVELEVTDEQANHAAQILSNFFKNGIYINKNLDKFEFYMKLGIKRNDYYASGNFGWYQFQEKNNIIKAEKFTKNALNINNNLSKIYYYNNLGVFENYKKVKNITSQIKYYKKAVEIVEMNNQYDYISWPFENLARIYLKPSKLQNLNMFQKYVKDASKSSSLIFISKYIKKEKIKKIDKKTLLNLYELATFEGFSQGYEELAWYSEDNKSYTDALKWALICNLSCDDEEDRDRSRTDIIKFKNKLNFIQKKTAQQMATSWTNSKKKRYDLLTTKFSSLNQLPKSNVYSNFGDYYALLIGIQDYKDFETLITPLKDINRIGTILKEKYNFKTELLENPNRNQILKALNEYSKKLKKNDNFILYFAGHGMQKSNEGFWIPLDAEKEDDMNWISNNNIVRKLREMKAKNILVLADTCFSGLITRGVNVLKNQNENKNSTLDFLNQTKTRIAITSGNNEPVLDGGGGDNSIFASALSSELNRYKKPFTATALFLNLQKRIIKESIAYGNPQNPLIMDIPKSGHENFDFVFNPQ